MTRQIILKNLMICISSLTWIAPSTADEYHRGQFLGLDLSAAVLSPNPLGPSAEFVPRPVEPKADPGTADTRAAAPEPREVPVASVRTEPPKRDARRHVLAHPRLAPRHGNPLDAQASDQR